MDKNPPDFISEHRGVASRLSWLWIALTIISVYQGLTWWQERNLGQLIQRAAQDGDIVMYSSDSCLYCIRAKNWLNRHGIAWQECNIDTHAECQRTFQAQGAPGTPLFQVGTQWQLGFDPQWISDTLNTRQHQDQPALVPPRPQG